MSSGEGAARRELIQNYRKKVVPLILKDSDNIVAERGFLTSETNQAERAFGVMAYGFEFDKSKSQRRVSKPVLQMTASILLEFARQRGVSIDMRAIAQQIPATLCDSRGLATLFDEKVSFSLADEKIQITPELRYRYAVAEIDVTPTGLTCYFDGSESRLTAKAKQLTGLAMVANAKLNDIAKAYPPLERVRNYAGLAAFLRWLACPSEYQNSCRRRNGLMIDFSTLGRYDLRDRKLTPTPDMVTQ
jgi:hypothetical protein